MDLKTFFQLVEHMREGKSVEEVMNPESQKLRNNRKVDSERVPGNDRVRTGHLPTCKHKDEPYKSSK